MNKVYRVVWNASLGVWVAVSELAKSKIKTKSVKTVVVGFTLTSLSSMAIAAAGTAGGTASGQGATAISADTANCNGAQSGLGEAKASGALSIAIGCSSIAESGRGIAIGSESFAGGNNESIAIGRQAKARGDQSIAIGGQSEANTANSVAIGNLAGSGRGDKGSNFTAGTTFAAGTVYSGGTTQTVTSIATNNGISIGQNAGTNSTGVNNTMIGTAAGEQLFGDNTVTIGTNANNYRVNGFSNGQVNTNNNTVDALSGNTKNANNAVNRSRYSVAIGNNAMTYDDHNIAIGDGAKALGASSIAMGTGARAGMAYATVGGVARGDGGSIAIGKNSVAPLEGDLSIGVNTGSRVNQNTIPAHQMTTTRNISVGYDVGGNVYGYTNTVIGTSSGSNIGTAAVPNYANVAIGDQVGKGIRGNNNVNIGYQGGNNITSNSNTSVGTRSGSHVSGADNVATGFSSGNFVNGSGNWAAGKNAGTHLGVLSNASSLNINDNQYYGTVDGVPNTQLTKRGVFANVAAGNNAGQFVGGSKNIAFGQNAGQYVGHKGTTFGAVSNNNIAMGEKAGQYIEGSDNFAVGLEAGRGTGTDATLTRHRSISQGFKANAYTNDSIAIGSNSVAGVQSANGAGKINAIAIGTGAQATGKQSISIGTGNVVSGDNSGAFGDPTTISGTGSYSVGNNNTIATNDTFVVGSNVTKTLDNSVFLGKDAAYTAKGASTDGIGAVTEPVTVGGTLTYGDFAGKTPVGVVSVGDVGKERRIQNMAAGLISATSTDAINGSQLYATNAKLGNVANTVVENFGGNATLDADGNITYTNIGNTDKDNIHDAIQAATTEVKAGTNVAGVTKDTGNNGQTIYTVNAKGTTATAGSDAITVAGTTDNTTNITDYKVDLSQGTKDSLVKADTALQTVVTQIDGENVKTINKDNNTANFVTGTNIKLESENGGIKVSTADDVTFTNVTSETMTVNNGNSVANGGDTNYVTEGSTSVVNGGDVYTAINTTEQQYTGDNGEIVKRNPTQVLTIKGGATTATENNIQTVANEDGSIAVKLAQKINLGPEGNVQLGNTLVDNSGVTIAGGPNGPVSITNTGLNNGGNTITNVGPGVNGTDAVNVNQLTETNTTIAKGFNITADNSELADNATEDNVKLGETVKYTSADGNIVTTVRDNKIDFGLGKDLTVGDDNEPGTIIVKGEDGKDGVSINGADGTIALNGKDGANGTISVKNGVPGVNGQDGITRIVIDDNEVATMKDGLKFQGNTGEVIGKQLNETLTVKGELRDDANASGANLRVDSEDGNLNLVMAKDLTDLDSIIINNGGPIINSTGINMGGKKITKVAAGTEDDDAVNFGQLNKVSGDVNKGLNFTGDDATIVINRQLGDALTIRGGATGSLINGNIGVVVNGNQLEVKMAENIDLGDNGSVTTGDSVVNNDGLTIAGGPSVTKDGIDAGDKKITGVAKGDISKDSTDAVNGSQLWDIKNKIDKDVAASKTEVEEGKNITVKEEKGADGQTIYKVSTSDEVEFDKVDVGSVSIDKNKVDKDGNTIISGVGAGKADTDAVNVGQLKDVVAGANKGFNVTAQGKNESNVANGGSIDFNNTDGNIKVQKATGSNDISFNLNPNLDLGKEGSITTGDTKVNNSGVTTGNTSLTNNGITINNAKPNSQDYDENKTVSVTDKGLNNGGNRITNVGPGVDGTDAVNMNQLKDFGYNLGNKIDKVGDEANAGVSSAMAMAALPQAYIPGKSMVTGGMATYNGQGAVAVGISKLSDNGRWVLKISGSADTEGNAGGAVGAGFHF